MCSRIQFLTLDTGEATALWKTFQKMKQNLSKISVFFLSLFNFFVWLFWCAFSRLWLRHLKQQNKRKMKLTQKFGALSKQIFLLLILWRTTKKIHFSIFFFQKNESTLQNEGFLTRNMKELLKSGRVKETRAPLHHKFSYYHQKQSQQTETYLGFTAR